MTWDLEVANKCTKTLTMLIKKMDGKVLKSSNLSYTKLLVQGDIRAGKNPGLIAQGR